MTIYMHGRHFDLRFEANAHLVVELARKVAQASEPTANSSTSAQSPDRAVPLARIA